MSLQKSQATHPNGGVETAFSGTRDQLIDILNEQFFTGGSGGGSGSGFSPTTEVLQSQVKRFYAETVVDAQAETFIEGERILIQELDEEYVAANIVTTSVDNIAGGLHEVGNKFYGISGDYGGDGCIYSFNPNSTKGDKDYRVEYLFDLSVDGVRAPLGQMVASSNRLYIMFLEGGLIA